MKNEKPSLKKEALLLMTAEEIRRCIVRIAHEILERNRGAEQVVLVGIRTRGVPFAQRLQHLFSELEKRAVPLGALDITLYRDDIHKIRMPVVQKTEIDVSLDEKVVVLCDDVIFTGRTVRAALDAIMDIGRPRAIQLAVLVDRGHRQLPIRPDFVGKNIPSRWKDQVQVFLQESDGEDSVSLLPHL